MQQRHVNTYSTKDTCYCFFWQGLGGGYASTPSLSMCFAKVEVKADEFRCPLVYFTVSFLGTQLVNFVCQIFIPIKSGMPCFLASPLSFNIRSAFTVLLGT